MKVTKKELKDRTFIPYEITIEITSESEHRQLFQDIRDIENDSRHFRRAKRQSYMLDLCAHITSHLK